MGNDDPPRLRDGDKLMELKRILYVEDDDDIRTVAAMALEMIGDFVVETCASGHEALEKAAAFAPDLLLLDVMMPGIDGPETLARLRRKPSFADTPAVFFKAKGQSDEIARLKALGAVGVVSKPFDPGQLSDELRRLWEHAHGG